MKKNPVGWFEIYVQDIQRATKFYETVLQTKLEKLDSPVKEIEMLSFPMEKAGSGAAVLWPKWEGWPQAAIARLSTSCAMIVLSRQPV